MIGRRFLLPSTPLRSVSIFCLGGGGKGYKDISRNISIGSVVFHTPMLPILLYLLVVGSYEGGQLPEVDSEKIETALKHYLDIKHLVEPVRMSSISSYTDMFRGYSDTLDTISKGVHSTLDAIFVEIRKEEGCLAVLRKEVSELEVRRQTLLMELATLRDEGVVHAEESRIHKQREQNLLKREKECNLKELELENERKVSYVKNIQNVLQEKTSENELLRRQLEFYKRGGGNSSGVKSVVVVAQDKTDTETQTCRLYDEEEVDVVEEVDREVDVVELEQEEGGAQEEADVVELEESEGEAEPEVEEISVEDEQIEAPVAVEEAEGVQEAEPEAVEEAEASEESNAIEVVDFEYKGVLYYLDPSSREVYQRMDDDDVGEVIGKLDKLGRLRRL